jgi:hypothetical protein
MDIQPLNMEEILMKEIKLVMNYVVWMKYNYT